MNRNAAIERAQKMLEAVRDGLTVFFRTGDGWDVAGPAHLIIPGAVVTVTKADGTTTRVIILDVMVERVVNGVATRTATFAPVRVPAPEPVRPVYNIVDRQAATVGGMLGLTSGAPAGYCHYCDLPLNRNGDCDECR